LCGASFPVNLFAIQLQLDSLFVFAAAIMHSEAIQVMMCGTTLGIQPWLNERSAGPARSFARVEQVL
jgi:hypothetical protein